MITVKFKKALAVLISCVIVLAHPDAIAERSASVKEDSLKIGRFLDKAAELLKKQSNKSANEHLSEAHACQALNLSRRSHYATGVGRSYFVLSEIYQRRKDLESAVRFLDSAISIFKKNELEKVFLADAYIKKADHFEISEKQGLETKIKCYEEAVKLLGSKMPISLKHADALKYLGDLYNVKEDNQRSIARLQQAIAIYRTLRYDKLQDIYCLLGAVMNRNGSSREGLKYLLLAEKAALKYNDSSSTVTTMYNRLGNVYNSLNQLSEANKAFRRSIFYARLNKDVDALLTVSANLGWSFIRIKEPRKGVQVLKDALKYCTSKDTAQLISLNTTLMEAYMHTGDPDKAFQCYYRIKDMIRQFYLYDFLLINYHHAAARLFLMINDHRKCEIQLRLAEMITSKSKNIRDMASTENIAYQLDSARKRPWQAMAHLSRYKQLNDSLNRRNHDRELSQLQIEYEMAKKDLDIASLKQRTLLQDRALSSEKLVRNLSVSGMLFFVIFTAVLYRSYRSKQKINKELNVKQQEVNAHNQSLRHLLNERGWLIKEVHHRVKNNFQIVISLLDSQSSFISDDAAMDVLRESRNRMHSISLVHQKLYQDESLKGINIKEYVIELTDILKDSFGISSWIRFEYDLPGLLLDASQIVPLGLIVNEAVTNAIKYAFKDRSDCVIHISVAETPDGLMEISIMDNGCGLPADFNVDQCTSLGMNLICGLTKQLQGELSMTTTIGLAIKVRLRRLKTLGSEYTSPSAVLAHA